MPVLLTQKPSDLILCFGKINSKAVDAFSQVWSAENNWLVPPINLVIRAIKHLVVCKARGTLIVQNGNRPLFGPGFLIET